MFHRPSLLAAAIALSGLVLAPLPVGATELPPDLVRLNNGGLLRGTIIEAIPGEKVVILLPSGETRTLAGDEFEYAGPASEAPAPLAAPPTAEPAAPEPQVTVRTRKARLSLQSPGDQLTWHLTRVDGIAVGTGGFAVAQAFDRLCTSPCEAEVPVGDHWLALSRPDGPPISARRSINVTGDGTLEGVYEDHSTRQLVGGSLFFVGLLGGLALTTVPLLTIDNDEDYAPYGITGAIVSVVGVVAGLIISKPNEARVTFQPE